MLKTERMKWVLVAGAKPQLVPVIETLQRLRALHIREHTPDAFFGYGDPLPEGERVAEARLVARGLEKNLGLDEAPPTETRAAPPDTGSAIAAVGRVEAAVAALLAERETVRANAKEEEATAARLRRLAPLGVRLEELSGYRSLSVFLGTTTRDPGPILKDEVPDHHLRKVNEGNAFLVAVFVAKRDAAKAEAALAQAGFHGMDAPSGQGNIDTQVGYHAANARRLNARLEEIEAALEHARREHGPALLAAQRVLTRAAERANAPLKFAASRHGFVVTGYVSAHRVAETERALQQATGQGLYIEWSEPGKPAHAHHGAHPEERAADPETLEGGPGLYAHGAPPEDPPVRLRHKRRGVAAFTHMLTLHSFPKYREIDPTILMYLTFPLFFAVMIGDLAFGLLIMAVALYLKNHYPLGIGGPKVSRMLMLAGGWTAVFGVFVYGEALGMHFVETPGHMSWEWLFSADWSHYYSHPAKYESGAAYVAAGGTPHLGFDVAGYHVQLGYLSKLHDVMAILTISLVLALIHLNLALFIGIYNHFVLHGAKHALLNRVSWLVLELGVAGIALGATVMSDNPMFTWAGWGLLGVAVFMLIGGEGVIGILELPKLFSNGLSYLRLAAVAMSKAGMALVVNTFGFVMVTDTVMTVNGAMGWVILILGHLIVLGLGIVAGGLHSMRLQLVEFFNWFYEGGGVPFRPFGTAAEAD